jgi:hypothetical protein
MIKDGTLAASDADPMLVKCGVVGDDLRDSDAAQQASAWAWVTLADVCE